jgi:hypothetical protein
MKRCPGIAETRIPQSLVRRPILDFFFPLGLLLESTLQSFIPIGPAKLRPSNPPRKPRPWRSFILGLLQGLRVFARALKFFGPPAVSPIKSEPHLIKRRLLTQHNLLMESATAAIVHLFSLWVRPTAAG